MESIKIIEMLNVLRGLYPHLTSSVNRVHSAFVYGQIITENEHDELMEYLDSYAD